MTQLDFNGLGAALQDIVNLRDDVKRREMLHKFKSEFASIMIGFRNARVAGQMDEPDDPAESCDLCGAMVEEDGLYVDGALYQPGGAWANMCMTCFLGEGQGIGWGVGQLYSHNGLHWTCIGGGEPVNLE